MKKKLVSVLLTAAMGASLLAGCGQQAADTTQTSEPAQTTETTEAAPATETTEAAPEASAEVDPAAYDGKEVKVWVAENVVDFTNEQIEAFKTAYPQYAGVNFTVEAVGEGDAAGNMITDVTAGADVFGFAQDQLTRLVTANALEEVNPDYLSAVESANSAGVVEAGKVGGTLYAYPMTADNGYFLYYDKSVVTDPSTLEGIIEQCEAAGKNFYMDMTGWYQVAFFFGTGCQLTYDTDDQGNFTGCNVDYASDKGLVALKEMIEVASSSAYQAGSSAGDAVNYAAIIDGTWDADTVKSVLGDNYACAKLPTFTGSDGNTYQLSGFNGCKLLGVKPQEDEDKLQICDDLAYYLTSEEVQLARFNAVGWGPSNLNAQASDAVKANEALSALAEQFAYTIPQGNYPGDYWTRAESLAGDVKDSFQKASDEDLTKALEAYQADLESYAK
ncbi:extracellular solute-binding protein [Butyrivibrio sp. INlla14]|uniref:extracellular solute-binding protein n=1 Tax=Butyrivibrio sp. INlla14 TaxID=1520808 RepID=UPI0008764FFF|nr:extracellular solute-binding protein [Butyrivibrio sp. INlla14]SCY08816.1 arabinogalactan oligomer / maltooligosaccharide transport system substrate-binding protein [Butyrivibrio sp. INlla14]